MDNLGRNILFVLAASFLIAAESIFSPITSARGQVLDYKVSKIEMDCFDRIVYSPEQGKINYSQADLINNPAIKGPFRALSIYFEDTTQNIPSMSVMWIPTVKKR